MRPVQHGEAGETAPVHPYLLRHARVRQLVRSTNSLPLAYLTISDEEVGELMGGTI